jgi:hypothetical protein
LTAVAIGIAQVFLPSESQPLDFPSAKNEHAPPEDETGFAPPEDPQRTIHRIV